MVAAVLQTELEALTIDGVSGFDHQLAKARRYYGAFLGCLGRPGKTLVHELGHVFGESRVGYYGGNSETHVEKIWEWRARVSEHCPSGCGQEKTSSTWWQRLGQDFDAAFPTLAPGVKHPEQLLFEGSVSIASNCDPVRSDEKAKLEWEITGWGSGDPELRWWASFPVSASDQAALEAELEELRAAHTLKRDELVAEREELRDGLSDEEPGSWAHNRIQRRIARRNAKIERLDRRHLRKVRRIEEDIADLGGVARRQFRWRCWNDTKDTTCDSGDACS